MKLLRYGPPGRESPGLLDSGGTIRSLSGVVDDIAGDNLTPAGLDKLRQLDAPALPAVDEDVRIGPCVAHSGKFIGIGLNYSDHATETGAEVPPEPVIFNKWTSAISGPNDDVVIPHGSTKTDWEVELGVVIGQTGHLIDESRAMAHVAGYCIVNDISERSFQMEHSGNWDKGKGCDTFGPIGPWLVTRDEIADPQALSMWLSVDGKTYQNGNTSTMIYGVPFLISYLSKFMSLHPGDIIATGTPPGVGMGQNPPVYLRPGQKMCLGITGLGRQSQYTVAARMPLQ